MSDIAFDWMSCTRIADQPRLNDWIGLDVPTTNAPNGPYAAGSSPIYTGQILDPFGVGIPAADISALTLTLVDVASGAVINSVDNVNILNTGRGTVDSTGNLTIKYQSGDTALSETTSEMIERAAVIRWTYSTSTSAGNGVHQVNFTVVGTAG